MVYVTIWGLKGPETDEENCCLGRLYAAFVCFSFFNPNPVH
jgi:hypothetical protein